MDYTITQMQAVSCIPVTYNNVTQPIQNLTFYQASPPIECPVLLQILDEGTFGSFDVTIVSDKFDSTSATFALFGTIPDLGQITGSVVAQPQGGSTKQVTITVGQFVQIPLALKVTPIPYLFLRQIQWSLQINGGKAIQVGNTPPLRIFLGPAWPYPVKGPPPILDYENLLALVARASGLAYAASPRPAPPPPNPQQCVAAAWQAPPNYGQPINYLQTVPGNPSNTDFKLQQWLYYAYGYTSSGPTADCYDVSNYLNLIMMLVLRGSVWQGVINNFTQFQKGAVPALRGGGQANAQGYGNHAVSMYTPGANGEGLVYDATLGPYCGMLPSDFLNLVQNPYTTPVTEWAYPPGTTGAFNAVITPYTLDGQYFTSIGGPFPPTAQSPSPSILARRDAFLSKVALPGPATAGTDRCAALPSLADSPYRKDNHQPLIRENIYNHPVARQFSVLGDKAESLYLEVWVSSGDGDEAFETFIEQGANAEFDTPFTAHPSDPAWFRRRQEDYAEHLWIDRNVVGRLRVFGEPGNDEDVVRWYRAQLLDPAAGVAPPRIGNAVFTPGSCSVGDIVNLAVEAGDGQVVRLLSVAPDMELLDGDGLSRNMKPMAAGPKMIRVVLGDPASLLTDVREVTLDVRPDA